ncbi:hypothetical protein MY11210_006508 [Beauveria gryllotalpidicola]
MKTAATAVTAAILAAGLVAAEPQHALPSGTKINCAKPNASYCMGGDIILRCGPDALGEPAHCAASVSGYPPAGGVAECWQSSRDAGDAACQKNCVVYAEDPFTLPADKCTPSATQTGQPTSAGSAATPTWASTGGRAAAAESSTGGSSSSSNNSSSGPPASSSTGSLTLPSSSTTPTSTISSSSSSSAYITLSPPPPGTATTPRHTGSNSTVTIPIITGSTSATRSTSRSSGGGSIITLTSTAGPKPTATTTRPNPNDAAANNAMSGLFVLGLAVAALF